MRYIDAEKLKKALCKGCEKYPECELECDITTMIDDAPAADVVSREVFEQIKFESELNLKLYESLLKDVKDFQGCICNYCANDQTDKCICKDGVPLTCGKFAWRVFDHSNEEKKPRIVVKSNDVVDVVRCCDCKHWTCDVQTGERICDVFWFTAKDCDYCSHAERKEDEQIH